MGTSTWNKIVSTYLGPSLRRPNSLQRRATEWIWVANHLEKRKHVVLEPRRRLGKATQNTSHTWETDAVGASDNILDIRTSGGHV